jgi:hypothetical protein
MNTNGILLLARPHPNLEARTSRHNISVIIHAIVKMFGAKYAFSVVLDDAGMARGPASKSVLLALPLRCHLSSHFM